MEMREQFEQAIKQRFCSHIQTPHLREATEEEMFKRSQVRGDEECYFQSYIQYMWIGFQEGYKRSL